MPNRIIKESINISRSLAACGLFSQDLFKRLITHADDFGCFLADPTLLLAALYPRETEAVDEGLILAGLIELAGVDKLHFYQPDDPASLYGYFPGWSKHQRLRTVRRRHPAPRASGPTLWLQAQYCAPEAQAQCLERQAGQCAGCGAPLNPWDMAQARLLKLAPSMLRFLPSVKEDKGWQCLCPACAGAHSPSYAEIVRAVQPLAQTRLPSDAPEGPEGRQQGFAEIAVDLLPDALAWPQAQLVAIERAVQALALPWNEADQRRALSQCQAYGPAQVLTALERAALRDRSRVTWGYIHAILERWEAQGYVDAPSQRPAAAQGAPAF